MQSFGFCSLCWVQHLFNLACLSLKTPRKADKKYKGLFPSPRWRRRSLFCSGKWWTRWPRRPGLPCPDIEGAPRQSCQKWRTKSSNSYRVFLYSFADDYCTEKSSVDTKNIIIFTCIKKRTHITLHHSTDFTDSQFECNSILYERGARIELTNLSINCRGKKFFII